MFSLDRQGIVDEFCILYQCTSYNGYPRFGPSRQKRLKSQMEKLVKLHPQWDANQYLQYFRRILNDEQKAEAEQRLAHLHLIAYLDQSRCYFVWQFSHKFPLSTATCLKFFDFTTDFLYNLEEFRKALNNYNQQDNKGAKLTTYIQGVLKNVLLNKIDAQSSWHLLCDVELTSQRKIKNEQQKLREALEKQGIIEPDISRYLFAWQCFVPVYKNNRVYNPNRQEGGKWPEPEIADFVEAARDYNSQRFQADAPLQVASGTEITPEMISQWMNDCIKARRNYTNIVEFSRDADSYEQEYGQIRNTWETSEATGDESDFLPNIQPIFQAEIERIDNNLDKIRSKITSTVRKAVMPLCYPHELSPLVQEQLAKKIGVNQGTIARFIASNYKATLLNKLDNLIIAILNNQLDTWAKSKVNEFLEERFSRPNSSDLIDITLLDAIATLNSPSPTILKLHYGQKMHVEAIAHCLDNSKFETEQIRQKINAAKDYLQQELVDEINQLKINAVNFWLRKYYRSLVESVFIKAFQGLELPLQEIMRLRFCQKMTEKQITKIKPNCRVEEAISLAKQQLQNSLLQWSYDNFGLSLEPEREQVSETVEVWLKTLYSVEL